MSIEASAFARFFHNIALLALLCFQRAYTSAPGEGGVVSFKDYDRKFSSHAVSRYFCRVARAVNLRINFCYSIAVISRFVLQPVIVSMFISYLHSECNCIISYCVYHAVSVMFVLCVCTNVLCQISTCIVACFFCFAKCVSSKCITPIGRLFRGYQSC